MGIKIDLQRCVGCGSCIPICPVGVLSLIDMKARLREGCTSCGDCVDICTFRAIELEEQPAEKKDS